MPERIDNDKHVDETEIVTKNQRNKNEPRKSQYPKGTAVLPGWWLDAAPHDTTQCIYESNDNNDDDSTANVQLYANLTIDHACEVEPVSPLTDTSREREDEDDHFCLFSNRIMFPLQLEADHFTGHEHDERSFVWSAPLTQYKCLDSCERTCHSCPTYGNRTARGQLYSFKVTETNNQFLRSNLRRMQEYRERLKEKAKAGLKLLLRDGVIVHPKSVHWDPQEWGINPLDRDYALYVEGTRLPDLYIRTVLKYATSIGILDHGQIDERDNKRHRLCSSNQTPVTMVSPALAKPHDSAHCSDCSFDNTNASVRNVSCGTPNKQSKQERLAWKIIEQLNEIAEC